MGPVEITFFIVIAIFIAIAFVRGYAKELGVTIMLLIALFVLEFINERYSAVVQSALGLITSQATVLFPWIMVLFLLVMTFISYQGNTLAFPGSGSKPFFNFGVGPAERLAVRRKHMVLFAAGGVARPQRRADVHADLRSPGEAAAAGCLQLAVLHWAGGPTSDCQSMEMNEQPENERSPYGRRRAASVRSVVGCPAAAARCWRRCAFTWSGIGGSGLSAIAGFLLERGYRVTGSDQRPNEMTDALAHAGRYGLPGPSAPKTWPGPTSS